MKDKASEARIITNGGTGFFLVPWEGYGRLIDWPYAGGNPKRWSISSTGWLVNNGWITMRLK